MTPERYQALNAGPALTLTSHELDEGWRFCECEWDGLLVNINDKEGEGQFCHCYKDKRKANG